MAGVIALALMAYAMMVCGLWLFVPGGGADPVVVTAPATGCRYLASEAGTSAPLRDAEGRHAGCRR